MKQLGNRTMLSLMVDQRLFYDIGNNTLRFPLFSPSLMDISWEIMQSWNEMWRENK